MGTLVSAWSSKWVISVVRGIWGGKKKKGITWSRCCLASVVPLEGVWSISILISLEILQGFYFMLHFHVCVFTQELLVLDRAIRKPILFLVFF